MVGALNYGFVKEKETIRRGWFKKCILCRWCYHYNYLCSCWWCWGRLPKCTNMRHTNRNETRYKQPWKLAVNRVMSCRSFRVFIYRKYFCEVNWRKMRANEDTDYTVHFANYQITSWVEGNVRSSECALKSSRI